MLTLRGAFCENHCAVCACTWGDVPAHTAAPSSLVELRGDR